MSRGRMTMRADVERNSQTGTDPHGHPLPAQFVPHATLPCFVWSTASRAVFDGDKTAAVEDVRAMFPLHADIVEADEIARIADRLGATIVAGRFAIDGPFQRKHRHKEAMLKRVA